MSRLCILGQSLALLGALAYAQAGVSREALPILEATYIPGDTASTAYAWRVTISVDGSVVSSVKKQPGWNAPDEWVTDQLRLTSRQLEDLADRIDSSDFGTLRSQYDCAHEIEDGWHIITCQPTETLKAMVGP